MNNICEIEVNVASGYSGREPYLDGQTDDRWADRRTAPYHNTTDFRWAYKNKLKEDSHHTIMKGT